VVLAGGAARRLGGAPKPALAVGGQPMLTRVLAAVADADPRIVVGPPDLPLPVRPSDLPLPTRPRDGSTGYPPGGPPPGGARPAPVPPPLRTREDPPGGGPVAAAAAGLALVPPGVAFVALLAADLPFLDPPAVAALRAAAGPADVAGAIYVDMAGRPQWLCGVWRADALRDRLAALPGGPAGAALGTLLRDLPAAHLRTEVAGPAPPPWFDCDTAEDMRRAEAWARRPPRRRDRNPSGPAPER
jgi:molybdopterin-guanine dinucleotide biosynthesis protein A